MWLRSIPEVVYLYDRKSVLNMVKVDDLTMQIVLKGWQCEEEAYGHAALVIPPSNIAQLQFLYRLLSKWFTFKDILDEDGTDALKDSLQPILKLAEYLSGRSDSDFFWEEVHQLCFENIEQNNGWRQYL